MPSAKSLLLAVAILCAPALLLPAEAGIFGPKEPYQEARNRAEAALKRGDYTAATNEMQSALDLAPAGEVQTGLDIHFRKLLQDYAWREHKQASRDDAFLLITRAWEDAPEKLQKSFAKSRDAILQAYAQHHWDIAQEELSARELATVVDEFTLAAMADNDLGREAGEEAARIQKLRKELELELSTAGKKIEGEEWPEAERRIRHVQDTDKSLVAQTDELANLLASRHCAAALRDGRAALEKNDFAAAYKNATDARSLNTGSTEPDTLLRTIRDACLKFTATDVARAIAEDRRNDIKTFAETMAGFSMDAEAARLRDILARRGRADDAIARADSSLRRCSPAAAVEHLTEATDLWPEHTEARKRLTATSTAMALSNREELLLTTRPLDQDDAFAFWQRTTNDTSGFNMR